MFNLFFLMVTNRKLLVKFVWFVGKMIIAEKNNFFLLFTDGLMKDFIVIADYSHDRILQINLKNGSLLKLPITVNSGAGIAFDISTKALLFSEIYTRTIMSTTLHGKETTLIYKIGNTRKYQFLSLLTFCNMFEIFILFVFSYEFFICSFIS